MEKRYAQALWLMIERGTEPAQAVKMLYDKLKSAGREALMPRIAIAFGHIAQKRRAKETLTLTVSGEKNSSAAKKHALAALNDPAVNGNDIDVRVDDSLIGGWRLEGRERLIDASYKHQLLSLYKKVTNIDVPASSGRS